MHRFVQGISGAILFLCLASTASAANFYMAIAGPDRALYIVYSQDQAAARAAIEKASARQVSNLLECGLGWAAQWKLEDNSRRGSGGVGIACNAKSRQEALSTALRACNERFGQSCLQSNLGRVYTSVWKVRRKDMNGPLNDVYNFSGDSCAVVAGDPQIGNCNIPNDLRALGLVINGNPVNNPTKYDDDPAGAAGAPASRAKNERTEPSPKGKAILVFRCTFAALENYKTSGWFSIWRTDKKNQYLVAKEPNKDTVIPARGFGTPNKGNFSITFKDNVRITIADNGWGTTSLDRVENKNSLYGPVSEKQNKPAGGCIYISETSHPKEQDERELIPSE